MFSLIEIKDTHSIYKSPIAKSLVEKVLYEKYNIRYTQVDNILCNHTTCENNITEKYRLKLCGVKIKDVFILKNDETNNFLQIGNTCIQNLVLENYISNIDRQDFVEIIKLLKIKNVCFLCRKNKNAGYHKKCLKGTNENIIVDLDQVRKHIVLVRQIRVNHILNILQKFFKNNTFLKNLRKNMDFNKKTMNALDRFIDNYAIIIDNIDKLQKFKNNCIIKSVSRATRNPSDKQLVILEKILDNYERMIEYDSLNQNLKYIKYGFIFPSIY